MDSNEHGTFLEDFVQSVELLPNDVRRNFELIRELDGDSGVNAAESVELGHLYINELSKKRDRSEDTLAKIYSDYKLKRQKAEVDMNEIVAIAEQTLHSIESFIRKLDTDLGTFENMLKGEVDFEVMGAQPGQEVAVRPDAFEKEWILGSVLEYHKDTGFYDILDVDDDGRYSVPESQVIRLDIQDTQKKFSKGEEVCALYPDTTAFYNATVIQGPRKSMVGSEQTVTVQFFGDADEFGQTPSRVVPLRYVMRPQG